MSADRELLVLAAKAAGLLPLPDGKELDYTHCGGLAFCGGGEHLVWNPLTDDGDALRLAVKLRMDFMCSKTIGGNAECIFAFGHGREGDAQLLVGDEMAATRRAIVRAAAEIGAAL